MIKNWVGKRFGYLIVIELVDCVFSGIYKRRVYKWLCQCDCGKTKIVSGSNLSRNRTKSCGCLAISSRKQQRGKKAPGYRGGKIRTKYGYIILHVPDHPNATKNGYMCEHRLVMEDSIGRFLTKNESVHHKNGVKDDNRLENLELWASTQPTGQRVEDLQVWALNLLEKYPVKTTTQ